MSDRVRYSNLRLWGTSAASSGLLVTVFELGERHHVSNKLSVQVGGAVYVWLALTVVGALATLWSRGYRPSGSLRIVLSVAVSLDLCVPAVIYPRHPSTRPVAARVIGAVLIVLVSAAPIWATIWGAMWILRRARPAGAGRRSAIVGWRTPVYLLMPKF
jgi:hypothetical protein